MEVELDEVIYIQAQRQQDERYHQGVNKCKPVSYFHRAECRQEIRAYSSLRI